MKYNFPTIFITLIANILLISSCQKSQIQTAKNVDNNQQQIQNINAIDISRLDNAVMVQFPAVLKKGLEANCIEIFSEDEFKKYDGAGKWSVPSRFAADARSTSFVEGKKVLVRGKMIFVKDVSDTSKTCGIVTGQLFEITAVQNFQ